MKYPSTNKIINPAATTEEIKEALAKQGMTVFTNEEFSQFIDKAIRMAVRDGKDLGFKEGLALAAKQSSIEKVRDLYAKEQMRY